jgi:hypothetical protein
MKMRLAQGSDFLERILSGSFQDRIIKRTYPNLSQHFPVEMKVNPLFEEIVNHLKNVMGNDKAPIVHYNSASHASNNLSTVFYEHDGLNSDDKIKKMKAFRVSYGPSDGKDPTTIERLHLGAFFYISFKDENDSKVKTNMVYCSLRWKDISTMIRGSYGIKFQTSEYIDQGPTLNPDRNYIFNTHESRPHPTRSSYSLAFVHDIPNLDVVNEFPVKTGFLDEKSYILSPAEIEQHLKTRYGDINEDHKVSIKEIKERLEKQDVINEKSVMATLNNFAREGRKGWDEFPLNYMLWHESPCLPIFGYQHVFYLLSQSGKIKPSDANILTSLDMRQGADFFIEKLIPAINYFNEKY